MANFRSITDGEYPDADDAVRDLANNRDALLAACKELVDAMRRYELDVDGDAPAEHWRMMRNAVAAIERAEASKT